MTKRSTSLLGAILAYALAAPIGAQGNPNFSGTWSLNEPRETRGKPVGGPKGPLASGGQDGFHPTVIIKQTATELTFEGRTYHQDPDIHVYKLDGSETK